MRILGCCSFSLIVRQWSSEITAMGRCFTSTKAVKVPVLASDRGKIVENHRKQRNDASSLTSKAVTGPGYGKVRHVSSLTWTQFSTDPHLGVSWKDGFSELRNFPRFFHDFSTIRVTKHKKSPCFTSAKNGDLSSKMVGMMRVELTTF